MAKYKSNEEIQLKHCLLTSTAVLLSSQYGPGAGQAGLSCGCGYHRQGNHASIMSQRLELPPLHTYVCNADSLSCYRSCLKAQLCREAGVRQCGLGLITKLSANFPRVPLPIRHAPLLVVSLCRTVYQIVSSSKQGPVLFKAPCALMVL